jgi:hypothetical protein
MKKVKTIFLIFLLLLLAFAQVAFSQTGITFRNPLTSQNFLELLDRVLSVVFTIALVVAPLMIILGAFWMVTSGGIPSRFKKGEMIILWTVVGFAIIIISRGIIALFLEVLGIP